MKKCQPCFAMTLETASRFNLEGGEVKARCFNLKMSFSMKRPAAALEPDWEIRRELAKLLGKDVNSVGHIRTTENWEISVIDVTAAVTGKSNNHSAEAVRALCSRFPEVNDRIVNFRFRGPGQRDTPIANLATMVEIIMLLPGPTAAAVRVEASKLLVRYLGGDLKLVDEVRALRHIQEELADTAPLHPLRTFGKAVEAGSSSGSELSAEAVKAMISEVVKDMNLVSKADLTAAFDETLEKARATMRIDHTRGVNPKSAAELEKQGIRLEGEEGKRIILEEKMLAVSDFLRQTLPKEKKVSFPWFARRLKAQKLEQCARDGTKPYLQHHMGEYRIAYMEADRPLMVAVLAQMNQVNRPLAIS